MVGDVCLTWWLTTIFLPSISWNCNHMQSEQTFHANKHFYAINGRKVVSDIPHYAGLIGTFENCWNWYLLISITMILLQNALVFKSDCSWKVFYRKTTEQKKTRKRQIFANKIDCRLSLDIEAKSLRVWCDPCFFFCPEE